MSRAYLTIYRARYTPKSIPRQDGFEEAPDNAVAPKKIESTEAAEPFCQPRSYNDRTSSSWPCEDACWAYTQAEPEGIGILESSVVTYELSFIIIDN